MLIKILESYNIRGYSLFDLHRKYQKTSVFSFCRADDIDISFFLLYDSIITLCSKITKCYAWCFQCYHHHINEPQRSLSLRLNSAACIGIDYYNTKFKSCFVSHAILVLVIVISVCFLAYSLTKGQTPEVSNIGRMVLTFDSLNSDDG